MARIRKTGVVTRQRTCETLTLPLTDGGHFAITVDRAVFGGAGKAVADRRFFSAGVKLTLVPPSAKGKHPRSSAKKLEK
jgi:hypothetical protein